MALSSRNPENAPLNTFPNILILFITCDFLFGLDDFLFLPVRVTIVTQEHAIGLESVSAVEHHLQDREARYCEEHTRYSTQRAAHQYADDRHEGIDADF